MFKGFGNRVAVILFLSVVCSLLFVVPAFSQQIRCLMCHSKFNKPAKSVHAALGMGCETCHQAVVGKNHPQKGSVKFTQDIPGLCYGCHEEKKFKGKVIHSPVAGGMCTSCHNPHQSDFSKLLISESPGLCYGCHEEKKFKGKVIHSPVAGGMCTSCHSPHGSEFGKLLISDSPNICYNCHDKAEFTKKNIHAAVIGGCGSCHAPHASENNILLAQPAINDLCLQCHPDVSKAPHALAQFKGNHSLGGKQVKKGDKMEMVKDRARPDRDFTCSSCHNPHSSDSMKLFRYKADTVTALCKYCHKKK